jgi:Tol biopolymer transport system component
LLGFPRGTLTTDPAAAASIVPMLGEHRPFLSPSVSPDGQMLAVQVQGLTDSIWVYDLQRRSGTMLNADGDASSPVWSPDSRRVTFRLSRGGAGRDAVVTMNADGSGAPDVLYESDQSPTPGSWSSDGRTLAFTQHHPHTGLDVWVLRMDRGGEARPFVQSPFNSWCPRFSPDGSLLAYASDHSGRPEVYVQAFPSGSRWQASSEGGHSPIWLPSGGELFFRSLNNSGATAVRIATQPTFMVGRPRVAFDGTFLPGTMATPNYDIHPKTGEFVLVRAEQPSEPTTQLAVVLNWFEEIRRRSSLILGSPQEA